MSNKKTRSEINREIWNRPGYRENQSEKHMGKKGYWTGRKRSKKTCDSIRDARHNSTGESANGWKGGIRISTKGYIHTYAPNHPFKAKNKTVPRMRLVAEQALGRYLDPEERVHHIDENKQNDTRENLFVFENRNKHQLFHSAVRHWGLPPNWLKSNIISDNGYT